MNKLLGVLAVAVLAAIGTFVGAQQGGSGMPGGSAFSTQYKLNSTTFGGTGPGSSGQVLTSRGAGLSPTFQASSGPTPAALTKTDDTNVTLTLGGTPSTALLQATSITAGWTGTLAHGRGGTDNTAAADDNVLVGDGTNWVTKALTSCSGATSAVTYNTTTNAWGCNTLSAGVSQTTGTFTANWIDGCTTTPTQVWNYVQTGSVVTLVATQDVSSCTADASSFGTSADVPVAIRPTRSIQIPGVRATNGSAIDTGIACLVIQTDGVLTVKRSTASDPCAGGFSNTGNKALGFLVNQGANAYTYPLN